MGYRKSVTMNDYYGNEAVVLGLCPTGLAVLRALGRSGITVKGIDKDRWAVGFFSRYCGKIGHFNIDNPEGAKALSEALIEYGAKKSEKPVIIATSDDFLMFLAKNNVTLRKYYVFSEIDENILSDFLNKKRFYEICRQNNMPMPKTFLLEDGKIEDISKRIPYPCIIKPIYTHMWDRKLKGLKAFKVNTPDEFIEKYNMVKALGLADNILAQEIIEGPTDDIYIFASYFDRNSNPVGIFTGRKIRQYPADFGNTTLAESFDSDEISSMAISLLRNMNYHGLCDGEFKRDKKDGRLKIVEINPRPGRWYGLVEEAGINLLRVAYLDLIGEKAPEHNLSMIPGKKWIFWERDIFTVLGYIKKKVINLKKYFKSISGKRVSAIYAKDDKLPALVFPLNQVLMILRKRFLCAR